MNTKRVIQILFVISGLYDGLLGAFFLFASGAIFQWYNVTPPNHPGYVQFSAALLIVFGIMFLAVAKDPVRNRNLILYGILLKVSYCGTVFYYWFTTGLPNMWKPFCIADFIFMLLFFWAWGAVGKLQGKA